MNTRVPPLMIYSTFFGVGVFTWTGANLLSAVLSVLVDCVCFAVKIARLYLLSDVLHNSSAPVKKASSYRTHLQKGLPEVNARMM